MTILCYRLLLLKGLLALVPLTLLCIFVVDEPLARLVHEHGAPVRPFFAALMVAIDRLSWLFHTPSPLGVPWAWSLLLLLFLVGRMRRWPHCTIWLVVLLTMVGSEGIGNLLKLYFNRPRPLAILTYQAPNADFWQPVGHFEAFPSGHTAWAAGLLLPLALRFPKVRPWLLACIGLVAIGRVGLEAHWLSDVVASVCLALVLTCTFEMATWWLRPKGTFSGAPSVPAAA
ncbi:undecaprenyl-diphosphatase [Hymenobacter luteus]|uniref:Undecaprenyl-diphosphatase n=2 Tax=Hymenobacter TaxID=89966 RepID=A0A7W9WBI7_9BACT|nr:MULTISPECIES: phosphatase PAP2 family protein [Hymenobacter]MBB4600760.1 undecaprenyl-diphosphatase [Hymenobacter latericoloratus]MBB6059033.1 undecaprenyl-diphosphatase [Hymenobacter luteus]